MFIKVENFAPPELILFLFMSYKNTAPPELIKKSRGNC